MYSAEIDKIMYSHEIGLLLNNFKQNSYSIFMLCMVLMLGMPVISNYIETTQSKWDIINYLARSTYLYAFAYYLQWFSLLSSSVKRKDLILFIDFKTPLIKICKNKFYNVQGDYNTSRTRVIVLNWHWGWWSFSLAIMGAEETLTLSLIYTKIF